ncbi:MAG: hypothetical protein V3V61_07465 [Gammaproteobacteria bacterium]
MMRKYSIIFTSILFLLSFTISNSFADNDYNYKKGWLGSEALQKELKLDESQKTAWNRTKEEIMALHSDYIPTYRQQKQEIKEQIEKEGSKEEPELILFYAYQEVEDDFMEFKGNVLALQLDLYKQLNPDQKRIIFKEVVSESPFTLARSDEPLS